MTALLGAFDSPLRVFDCGLTHEFARRFAVQVGSGRDERRFVVRESDGQYLAAGVASGGSAGAGRHGHEVTVSQIVDLSQYDDTTSRIARTDLTRYDKCMPTNERPAECAECEKEIVGEPVRDAEQAAWLGDDALTFCTTDCLLNAGERQATS